MIDREALRITLRRFPLFLGAARRLGLADEAFTPADQWVSAFIKPYQPAIVAEYHHVVAKERPQPPQEMVGMEALLATTDARPMRVGGGGMRS